MRERGQVMILTVLALGGTILGATAIAGTLMLYQLRQAKNIQSSTEAIYNADAGIECGLEQFFSQLKSGSPDFSSAALGACNTADMAVNFDCLSSSGAENSCGNNSANATPTAIISIGSAANGSVRRAFYISIQSTSTILTIPQ